MKSIALRSSRHITGMMCVFAVAEVEAALLQVRAHVLGLLLELATSAGPSVSSMVRMVAAAATMGTGSVALNTNERARCLMWSTTSVSPRMIPPMPPKALENVETTTSFSVGKALEPVLFEDAAAVHAERAGAVRVVEHHARVVALADLEDLLDRRLVAVERVDALEAHERVLALAVLSTRSSERAELWLKKRTSEPRFGRPRRGSCRRGCRRGSGCRG
jgi:hypothetical protein